MFIAEFCCFIGSVLDRRFFSGLGKSIGISWILPCMILSAFFSMRPAMAHPVSQGAMDIIVRTDRIDLRATVSLEEVLVATSLGWKQE